LQLAIKMIIYLGLQDDINYENGLPDLIAVAAGFVSGPQKI
jgi:hypothetical protein